MTMTPAEPHIVVNGVELSEGQAMSLRIAVEALLLDFRFSEAGDLGQTGRNYRDRLTEVRSIMARTGTDLTPEQTAKLASLEDRAARYGRDAVDV